MSLPYYSEFGWRPVVLAVEPAYVEGLVEPLLLETVPSDISVYRVPALPIGWTCKFGLRNLGVRAFPFLYGQGSRIIRRYGVDLVYFSTAMFPAMTLGRLWKKRFRVPFILDLQDPWVSDYFDHKPRSERPPKYWLSQRMHKVLEPWTMRKVDGIVAVSEKYHEALRRRYPWLRQDRCRTIPFGGAALDYEVAAKLDGKNPYFDPGDGFWHGVYAGVLGNVMQKTSTAICLAFQKGLRQYPELFSKVRLHFIGTTYAGARPLPTIEPIAKGMGLSQYIHEDPNRAPYFTVLKLLEDTDFLLVPGSDNPQYTASKIYPYILAQRPLLAVFHEASSVVDVLRSTQAGELATFSSGDEAESIANLLLPQWVTLLRRLPYSPPTKWEAVEPYTAREMTRRQCELFDQVLH